MMKQVIKTMDTRKTNSRLFKWLEEAMESERVKNLPEETKLTLNYLATKIFTDYTWPEKTIDFVIFGHTDEEQPSGELVLFNPANNETVYIDVEADKFSVWYKGVDSQLVEHFFEQADPEGLEVLAKAIEWFRSCPSKS